MAYPEPKLYLIDKIRKKYADYLRTKRIKDKEYRKKRAKEDKETEKKIAKVREIVAERCGVFNWSNGYVYDFTVDGRLFHICDQDTRIVGCSYMIPDKRNKIILKIANDNFLRDKDILLSDLAREAISYYHYCLDGDFIMGIYRIIDGDYY